MIERRARRLSGPGAMESKREYEEEYKCSEDAL